MKLIKDLPPAIKKLALKQQVKQGNKENDCIKLSRLKERGNFNWGETKQHLDWWKNVHNNTNYKELWEQLTEEQREGIVWEEECIPTEEEEFEVPKNWYVVVDKENREILERWRNSVCDKYWEGNILRINHCVVSKHLLDKSFYYAGYEKWLKEELEYTGYKKLTTEQFKKYILKENTMEQAQFKYEPFAILGSKQLLRAMEETLVEMGMESSSLYSFLDNSNSGLGLCSSYDFPINREEFIRLLGADISNNKKDVVKFTLPADWDKAIDFIKKQLDHEDIPEYVECLRNTLDGGFTIGKIYKIRHSLNNTYFIEEDDKGDNTNGWGKEKFKPSTKEVYDKQNEVKVGDWAVVTERLGRNSSMEGHIARIIEIDNNPLFNKYCLKDVNNLYNWAFEKSWCKGVRKATPQEIEKAQTKVFNMGSFELKVIDGKVFFNSEDITQFVKDICSHYDFNQIYYSAGKYTFTPKDVIFSKTGCQHNETKLSDWLKVYQAIS